VRSIWDQSLRVAIGGGASRGSVSESSSKVSNSRGGDEWPPPERKLWGDNGFAWKNGAVGLQVAASLLEVTWGRAVPAVREKRGASAMAWLHRRSRLVSEWMVPLCERGVVVAG